MLHVTFCLDRCAEFLSTPGDLHLSSSSSANSISEAVIPDINSPEQKPSSFFFIMQFLPRTPLIPSTNLRSRKCEKKINRNLKKFYSQMLKRTNSGKVLQ